MGAIKLLLETGMKYFRDFQMLKAVKIGKIQSPHHTLGQRALEQA